MKRNFKVSTDSIFTFVMLIDQAGGVSNFLVEEITLPWCLSGLLSSKFISSNCPTRNLHYGSIQPVSCL